MAKLWPRFPLLWEGGVNLDAVSASANNRLGRWSIQRKSRVAAALQTSSSAPGTARRRGALETYLLEILRVPLYLLALLVIVVARDTVEVCSEEFGLGALVMESGVSAARRCLLREVLWDEEGRVSFVPEKQPACVTPFHRPAHNNIITHTIKKIPVPITYYGARKRGSSSLYSKIIYIVKMPY